MRRDSSAGSFPIEVFFAATCVTAVIICAVSCVVFSEIQDGIFTYQLYLVFLFAASIISGLIVALVAASRIRSTGKELGYIRGRLSEKENEIHNLQDDAERREEFFASFTHELKTPLTAIIGYADMLRSKDMAPKPRFTAAGYIFSEGKRLEALSLKLMDIIVAGKQSFELRRFEAGYFLREVAAVAIPSTAKDGMKLEVHAERGEIEVEPDLFKTLMINLVDNARKASRRDQSIQLLGKVEPGGYALYVVDNGHGMKKEELSKITEPFYMVDKSRSREQNGAGLGLALCQRIAELHGTTLEYDSEPGKGTTVRVFLKGGDANV